MHPLLLLMDILGQLVTGLLRALSMVTAPTISVKTGEACLGMMSMVMSRTMLAVPAVEAMIQTSTYMDMTLLPVTGLLRIPIITVACGAERLPQMATGILLMARLLMKAVWSAA